MPTSTKVFKRDASGVIFVDPDNPTYSVRFKTVSARKSIDGLPLQNVATDIIVNDTHMVTVGEKTVGDPLSIRVRTSGATVSMTRLSSMLISLAAQLQGWTGEDVLLGFEPTTVPVNPTVV